MFKWLKNIPEFIAATLLAAMFGTFLLQIFSRYLLQAPFGWTLELCLILWVWIVFFGCAFLVKDQDHVIFDIFYLASPRKTQRVLAAIGAIAIIAGMAWAYLPTLDYIDWMKIRKTSTVRNPFDGQKIPLRTIFSVYMLFMSVIIARYTWRLIQIFRDKFPPDSTSSEER